MILLLSFLIVSASPMPADTALALNPVEITEWPVPWADTRPRDPFVDAHGRTWFVGQRGDYVAYLNSGTGEFRRFDLSEGSGPHNLIVDDGGQVWFAGNRDAYIGRLDPESGDITRFEMPDPAARDPHTLAFDPAGDIWFTVQGGNFVGRLTRKSGDVELVRVPTERARPYGIVVANDGRPWFNEFGTNKIGTVDPQTMEPREFTLPAAEARGRRIELTRDGGVWYADYARGYIGRLDPASGEVREWATPGGPRSQPYAMAVDDRGRLWVVESGASPNRVLGFDPAAGEFFSSTPIASGGGTVRHMVFHAPTRELWFGTDTNTIGRARVP
jgi:virginiamycin B lyase